MLMELKFLKILFLDAAVISWVTNDPYDTDDSKKFTLGSRTDIINKIKEMIDDIMEIVNYIIEITQNFKKTA
jgi:hypothetical protein